MANSNPPVRGQAFSFSIALSDALDPKTFKSAPTIASGDFQIKKDGGTAANLTNLPTADGIEVSISLTATEMTADKVFVQAIDQTATKEWADFAVSILTTSA